MEANMIRTVPTETLELIEVQAEMSGNWEASELCGSELDRREMARIALLGIKKPE